MSALTKGRLIFDPADLTDSDNIGSYLRAGSDGDLISSTLISGKEALDVNVVGSSDGGIFAEDSAHTTADLGQHILAVRNDTQGSLVDTDGDYASLQLDSAGRLRTVTDIDLVGDIVGDDEPDTEDPLKVGSHAYDNASALGTVDVGDKANLASDTFRRIHINDSPQVNVNAEVVTLGLTEVAIPASAMAGRTRMMITNDSVDDVHIGATGLSTASGFTIPKKATLALEIGQAISLFGLAGAASRDVRILELG